jgi:hypothetical protein
LWFKLKKNPLQKDTTYSVTSCKLVSAKQLFRLMMMNHRSRSSQLFQRFVRLFVCSNVLFVHSFPLSLKTFPSETSLQETAMSNYLSPQPLMNNFFNLKLPKLLESCQIITTCVLKFDDSFSGFQIIHKLKILISKNSVLICGNPC